MFIHRVLIFFSLFLMLMGSVLGEATRAKGCRNSLMNLLHRWESGSDEPLEIFEFRHGKDTQKIFADQNLKISPVPLVREIFGIYRRPLIARGARSMFKETRFLGNVPDSGFVDLLKKDTYYTYIIDDEKIIFAQTRPGKMRDYASKHAILRDQRQDLRLAGEFWVDDKGVFHFDGSSGTFQPTNAETSRGLTFFKEEMGIKNTEVHYFDPSLIPVPEVLPPKYPIFSVSKVVGQTFIPTTVRYATVEKAVAYELESADGKKIDLNDDAGRKVTYKLVKRNTLHQEETLFDTKDFSLHKNHSELRSPSSIDKESEAFRLAKSKGASEKEILPMVKEEQDYIQYFAYPIVDGKTDKTQLAFSVKLSEKTFTGLDGEVKGKKTQRFETRFEGSEVLVKQLQEKYQGSPLTKAPLVSGVEILSALP